MITNSDLSSINLSATKKDFYQIWNELLDIAKKLSERWDPTSTNESDPGIVLLKVLTGIADALNYNIDKNILEAFMPSAAQEESMRKLCEMLGYSPKYYQSAMTEITFAYIGDEQDLPDSGLVIPEFLPVMNADKDIQYIVSDYGKIISNEHKRIKLTCIEGQIVQCESESNNIISTAQLDDNFRYYLPETQVAENGIFIYDINDGIREPDRWQKVTTLNICQPGTKVYKFGYDSKEARPYLQFPEDVAQIMGDGLLIYYVRTSGINGNISARTLSTFEYPDTDDWKQYKLEDFVLFNESSTTNGANTETIEQAYNSYNKTIGTFETLVTCRDYMNKIYQLTNSINNPLVSNSIVSDIRDDINKATTICTMDEYGIKYITKPFSEGSINHFDLIIYPFKSISTKPTISEYNKSFEYTGAPLNQILQQLDETKLISHNIKLPDDRDIVCIRNYLKLSAKITTVNKVTELEGNLIIANIKDALCSNFNLRNLDFGEEIPYESILEVIQNADQNIKNVALDDPILYTVFVNTRGEEYPINSAGSASIYNQLALRNILSGSVELFKYNTNFTPNLNQTQYADLEPIYNNINKIETECNIDVGASTALPVKLYANEVIKFRAPSLTTIITYPAYVNYFLHLKVPTENKAKPASFITLNAYLTDNNLWETFIADGVDSGKITGRPLTQAGFNEALTKCPKIFIKNGSTYEETVWIDDQTDYYWLEVEDTNWVWLVEWVKEQTFGAATHLSGIYKKQGSVGSTAPYGYLVDIDKIKYAEVSKLPLSSSIGAFRNLYIQNTNDTESSTIDGLGSDAKLVTIKKGTIYQLSEGEYLCINYTEKGSENGQEAIINKYYDSGDIICPNFDLVDSQTKYDYEQVKWSKTVGYDFGTYLNEDIPGMFTMGVNDQIQIKEITSIELADQNMSLYWVLKEDHKTQLTPGGNPTDPHSYIPEAFTLSDGEYIFYTDEYKTAMAYYGSGTKITLNGNISLPVLNDNISITDIFTEGIDAIPWHTFNFDADTNIKVEEYQYISLTENDELLSIFMESNDNPELDNWTITNDWKKCSNVKYRIGNSTDSLPQLVIQNNTVTWEVRSLLEFNIGKTLTQIIGPKLQNGTVGEVRDYFKLYTDTTPVATLSASQANGPLCLQCSKLIQLADNTYIVAEENPALSILTFGQVSANYTDDTAVKFNNLNNYWTSIPGNKLNNVEINSLISTHDFGLLSIYVSDSSVSTNAVGSKSYIYLDIEDGEEYIKPVIFNNQDSSGDFCWWEDGGDYYDSDSNDNHYYLHNGLNVIQFVSTADAKKVKFKFKISPDADIQNLYVTMSRLDLVDTAAANNKYGINLQLLDYRSTSSETSTPDDLAKELLNKIATIDVDHEFYYNFIVDNSLMIDFKSGGKLSDAEVWYDHNNANNKFVISKIDIDNLEDTVQISRISKR